MAATAAAAVAVMCIGMCQRETGREGAGEQKRGEKGGKVSVCEFDLVAVPEARRGNCSSTAKISLHSARVAAAATT